MWENAGYVNNSPFCPISLAPRATVADAISENENVRKVYQNKKRQRQLQWDG